MRSLERYRMEGPCPDGKRASSATFDILDVATRAERRLSEALPGRGIPKDRRWLGERCDTKYGQFLHVRREEADAIFDVYRVRLLRRRKQGLVVRGIAGVFNASLDEARSLPEYDAGTMGDWQFLSKRFVDKLASAGAWAEVPWYEAAEGRGRYEQSVAMLAGTVRHGNEGMMTGRYIVQTSPSGRFGVDPEVDVSMLLPKGVEAFVLGPCDLCETISIWPAEAIGDGAEQLVGSLVEETDADESTWRMERWQWLHSFTCAHAVKDGLAPLTDTELSVLGVSERDEVLVVGDGNHIEIWEPGSWDEAERQFEQDLLSLMDEYADGTRP